MLATSTPGVSRALQVLAAERLLRSTNADIKAPCTLDNADWPPDYEQVYAWRAKRQAEFDLNPEEVIAAEKHYSTNPVDFINHWCNTYDPRNSGTSKLVNMPLIMFRRQEELVMFIMACILGDAPGMVEKSRDMGATWIGSALSVWMWKYWDASAIGWGSNNADKVDIIDNPDSVIEKIRILIRGLPEVLRPANVLNGDYMKQRNILNPVNRSTIRGEINRQIGRGGRTRVYFVDETAHLEYPERVEASLSENTRCRIDISSVSGLGSVFHRSREAGVEWAMGQPVHRDRMNIFVMDWREHPEKDQEWYDARKNHFVSRGMAHVVAREIDRDYAATVEGIIIPYDQLQSCIDAHLELGFDDDGGYMAGLDVADEGGDMNALTVRKGWVVKSAQEWGERDPGATARRAVGYLRDYLPVELQYDAIGIGTNIKSETNRLRVDGHLPEGLKLIPWNAGAKVLNPNGQVIPKDQDSPKNRDYYSNLKAQGWWELGRRVYRTHQARTEGAEFDFDQLISFDSKSIGSILNKLLKELAQAQIDYDTRSRLKVDKAPDGMKSPNLGDAAVMMCWPWRGPRRSNISFHLPKIIQG